ncbi:MAG: helicase, partial [Pseudonocardia sp.]|nr:helicase [Pseudonocardia sp.]
MARGDQRSRRAHRTAHAPQRRVRDRDDDGIIPVLARTAREVETAARRGRVLPSDRTKFQVVAVLARQERARVRSEISSDARRSEMLKRLDGIALILAQIATHDTSLLELLAEDAVLSDAARTLMRKLLK